MSNSQSLQPSLTSSSHDDGTNGTAPRSTPSYPSHPSHPTQSSSRRGSTQPFPPLSPTINAETNPNVNSVPQRLPRPLTPAEMHMELEREQEAIVNRLTREITALQTATNTAAAARRASTASNVSASGHGRLTPTQYASNPPTPGIFALDQPAMSLAVGNSARNTRSGSTASQSGGPRSGSIGGHGVAMARSASGAGLGGGSVPAREEIERVKVEYEDVKRENEMLKERIRELERKVREKGGEP